MANGSLPVISATGVAFTFRRMPRAVSIAMGAMLTA